MIQRIALLTPLAWRNLWRNPRRTLITLVVVAIGVWSILLFDVMIKAVADSSREQTLRLLTGHGQIHATGYLDDPGVARRMASPSGPLLTALNSPPVTGWAARVRVPAVIQSEYRTRSVTLLGVSPAAERKVSDIPSQVLGGRYLAGDADEGIYIGQDLAEKLKTRIGKRVIVMTQAGDGRLAEASFPIIGVYGGTTAAQDEFVFTGLATTQNLLGIGGDISEISFDGAPKVKLDTVVGGLKHAAPGGLDVQSWLQLSPLAATVETFSQSFTFVWLLIMFVLMAIGIVNTQLMAVFERTREFGLLQALGMRPGLIVLQVAIESALLIGLGVIAGVILMVIFLVPMRGGVDLGAFASGMSMAGLANVLYPRLNPVDAVVFSIVVWLLGVGAALWPARMAARARPVVAMAETP
jgi:ABC-type lipoprotein release transport system permease subunit